jgi:hypothetical protein
MKNKTKNIVLAVVGAGAVGGTAWYFFGRNKNKQVTANASNANTNTASSGSGSSIIDTIKKAVDPIVKPATNTGIVAPSTSPLIPAAKPVVNVPTAPTTTVKTSVLPVSGGTGAILKDADGNTFQQSSEPYDSMRNWILVNGKKNGAGKNLRVVGIRVHMNSGNTENAEYAFIDTGWQKLPTPITSTTTVKPTTTVTSSLLIKPSVQSPRLLGFGNLR